MNQAFAYLKQGEVEKARESLTMAIQVKVEKKHECASEALQLLQVWFSKFDIIIEKLSLS